jgi:hypothetical protein
MSQTVQEMSELELIELHIQLSHLDAELQEFCHMLRTVSGNVNPEQIRQWQDDPINAYPQESLGQMTWKIHHLRQLIHLHQSLYRNTVPTALSIAEMQRDAIRYLDSR